ncbi:MAG TPA: chorismate mutase [Bryobacteraceae bacterium]|nr:chorismate mutase [Bryobacteraceae bacterium]
MTEAEAEWLLAECRRKIDELDFELREMLNRRADIARDVVRAKRILGRAVYDPQREEQVLRRVAAANPGPLSAEAIGRIFEAIIRETRDHEAAGS